MREREREKEREKKDELKKEMKGSGCGSVGRGVASKSKGMQFESSHQQKIILNIYCQLYRKDENREKEAGNGPFLKRKKEMKEAE